MYIGSSVRIEPGVSVTDPAWIGHGSHLRAGAKVVRSVLFAINWGQILMALP